MTKNLGALLVMYAAIAWIMSGVKFFSCDFDAPYKCEVTHGIGLVVPAAATVTVWMGVDE